MNPEYSRSTLRSLLAVITAATLLLLSVGQVSAQGATPVSSPGAMTAPTGCTVFADGLLNPRFIAFDDSSNLYVTEAGSGGSQAFYAPAAGYP